MINKIDELPFVNEKNAFFLMIAMHVAGVIGLSLEITADLFKLLVPFNLLATGAILLHFEKEKSLKYGAFIFITFLVGFFAEVIGVATGAVFGEYSYGETLGFKVLDVPLAIGINWIVLIYCTAHLSRKITNKSLLQIVIASVFMVAFDLLIEPVAINLDFWSWEMVDIPLRNYLGWFVVSLLLHAVFLGLMTNSNNSLAIKLLYIQVAFFVVLNFI
ncbi:carotenoid biosynthesis protein [Roseivirga sp.]|uniref:carotenoid biosynthesis protein n=1 Tax=Roseivirga sp. TaxID=1964215 RepID=UPI003B8CCFD6